MYYYQIRGPVIHYSLEQVFQVYNLPKYDIQGE